MKLYNTLSRKKEEFIAYNPNMVTMYTCGPTVYHYAHIGNLRSYIFEDILEKTLRYIGYPVKRVMNITDVGHLSSDSDSGEDKMLKGAKREHKSVLEIAQFYTEKFLKNLEDLNIKKPEIISKATEHIDDYIQIIQYLIEKKYAYVSGGNVYFDVSKLEDYYQLTNHKIDEMVVGVRAGVEEDQNKRNQADFALWFTKSKFDDQELKWDSPWGMGYPGWHIECSTISIKYLGEYLDIHCGGVDNIFPHHTNEIAQSEAYLGHQWCRFWCHGEHLKDDTGKMSKSKGTFLTLELLKEQGYDPVVYRMFCLNSHYRKTLLFNYKILDDVQKTYEKIKRKIDQIQHGNKGTLDLKKIKPYKIKFQHYLEDDLNTANALTVLYQVLKDQTLTNLEKITLIEDFDQVLSLDLLKQSEEKIDGHLKQYIEEMIEKRNQAKREKNYLLADQIREELLKKNITLMDTKDGTKYEIE